MKRTILSAIGAGLIAALGGPLLFPSAPLQAQGPTCSVNSNPEVGSPAANANTVLILEPTVAGGCSSQEAVQSLAEGYFVEVASSSQWAVKTEAQFATYRALILGDGQTGGAISCFTSPTPIAAAEANRPTWAPVVTGKIVVIGSDPLEPGSEHEGDPGQVNGRKLARNGIKFAAGISGHTGLYLSLNCYYFNAPSGTAVPVLDQFGTFTVVPQGGTADSVNIVDAGHPVVTDPNPLSAGDLSNWSVSVHERFASWPAAFTEVAEQADDGKPYILVRGRQHSETHTFTPAEPTYQFVRDSEVSAKLTFEHVLQPFNLKFTFTTVSKMAESARLDPDVFGLGAQCLSYDSDATHCVRHTVRRVDDAGNDMGVPTGDNDGDPTPDFTGNFRLELGFHDVDVNAGDIGPPFLAQAKHDEIEEGLDLYDRDIMTSFRYNSCNCVGVGETDGFSDFIMGERLIPEAQEVNFIGPLPPIKLTPPLLSLKTGQALPVKFRLTDSSGAFITSGVTAVLDIWLLDPSGEIPNDAVNRAGTEFVFNFSTNVWERISSTAGWPKGDYVGIIRSVYVSPGSVMFSPVKFNFSVRK
jgi:hypothetical protein